MRDTLLPSTYILGGLALALVGTALVALGEDAALVGLAGSGLVVLAGIAVAVGVVAAGVRLGMAHAARDQAGE